MHHYKEIILRKWSKCHIYTEETEEAKKRYPKELPSGHIHHYLHRMQTQDEHNKLGKLNKMLERTSIR